MVPFALFPNKRFPQLPDDVRADLSYDQQYLHDIYKRKDILSHTSIVRLTKQIAATLEVSLVVLGPPWGPLWPWAYNMPILDLYEVGKNKKPHMHRLI